MWSRVNKNVRAVEGVNGEIVILGAWCPGCLCEVLPSDRGFCMWCDRRILDEHVGEVLEGIRQPTRAMQLELTCGSWTHARAIEAVRSFALVHGRPPTRNFFRDTSVPSPPSACRLFGSWAAMIEAAGFPRPNKGTRYKVAA